MPVYVEINSINLLFCFSASRVPVVSIMREKGQAYPEPNNALRPCANCQALDLKFPPT